MMFAFFRGYVRAVAPGNALRSMSVIADKGDPNGRMDLGVIPALFLGLRPNGRGCSPTSICGMADVLCGDIRQTTPITMIARANDVLDCIRSGWEVRGRNPATSRMRWCPERGSNPHSLSAEGF